MCVHFFSETTSSVCLQPMKPKFMWNHNRIGEESFSNDAGHLLFFIIVSPREGGAFSRDLPQFWLRVAGLLAGL